MGPFGHVCALFVGFCLVLVTSGNDLKPGESRTYLVQTDPETNSTDKQETEVECWQFTWVGPDDKDVNNTKSCDFLSAMGIPCFEPLVFTTGEYKYNSPNLTQVDYKCKNGLTDTGETCVPTCPRGTKSCVTMTYRLRDKEGTIDWQTHFCGEGYDVTNNNKIIDKGCFTQKSNGDHDIEACFCQKNLCNVAHLSSSPSSIVFVLVSLTYLISSHT